MKPNIRWQLLLALVCLGLVLSLLSFQVQTVGLCTTRVPAEGGTLAEGIVGAPQYINPLLSDPNPVDRELVSLIFDGLLRYDENGELVPALAESWEPGADGRSVTFTLRQDVTWHDGEPFTAADVVFSYSLLREEALPIDEGLRALWRVVAINSNSDYQVTFTLPEPYAPFLDMTTRGIVPAHILQDVPPAEIASHDFNRFPVGTGPFRVSTTENWTRTGRLHLLPNPAFWPQGLMLNDIAIRFYPDNNALIEAYVAGEVQAANHIPAAFLPEYLELPRLRRYTAPTGRFSQLLFNLSDSGIPALREVEVRRALAYGLDRQAILDNTLNGQGLLLDGPYLPTSWAYNESLLTHYTYDAATAGLLLDTAGWTIPAGTSVRQRSGSPIIIRLLYWDVPPYRDMAAAVVEQWTALNIRVESLPTDLEGYQTALAGREFDVALADVTPPGDPDLYAFWSQEAVVRGQNYAGWNNRRASEALEQARQLWSVEERRPLYEAFLAHYDNDLPALTLFQHIYNYGISDTVREVEIGRIDSPRERYTNLAEWFLLYRDVLVACPEDEGVSG